MVCSGHACFHPGWSKLGMVNELILMKEEPEFIHELFSVHTQLIIDIYDGMLSSGVELDGAFMADDLGFNHGPFFSPAMCREMVFPYH